MDDAALVLSPPARTPRPSQLDVVGGGGGAAAEASGGDGGGGGGGSAAVDADAAEASDASMSASPSLDARPLQLDGRDGEEAQDP
jgi:hypothetical protein